MGTKSLVQRTENPTIRASVEKIIAWFDREGIVRFELDRGLVGGAAYDAHGQAISEEDMAKAQAADAVIFGAVGGPKWDKVPYEVRPEAGLLRLRKDLGLFANLRPAICYPALADASSLKRDVVEGLDMLIVRELTGGVYFGEPKTITDLGNGQKRGVDTQVYDTFEIDRIARVAFDLARTRRKKVASAEKRNVMKTGVLWNEVVTRVHQESYKDVALEHVLADDLRDHVGGHRGERHGEVAIRPVAADRVGDRAPRHERGAHLVQLLLVVDGERDPVHGDEEVAGADPGLLGGTLRDDLLHDVELVVALAVEEDADPPRGAELGRELVETGLRVLGALRLDRRLPGESGSAAAVRSAPATCPSSASCWRMRRCSSRSAGPGSRPSCSARRVRTRV